LTQQLLSVGTVIKQNPIFLVRFDLNCLTKFEKRSLRQIFEKSYIFKKIVFIIEFKGNLTLPEDVKLISRHPDYLQVCLSQKPVIGTTAEIVIDLSSSYYTTLTQYTDGIWTCDALLVTPNFNQSIYNNQTFAFRAEKDAFFFESLISTYS